MKKVLSTFLLLFLTHGAYAKNEFVGTIQPIPVEIQQKMVGVTWNKNCPFGFDQLAYLKMSYWGFDNQVHQGEMIINKKLAKEVVSIFEKLFANHFQIESMKLPENIISSHNRVTAEDNAIYSRANNTSGFYCRADAQIPSQMSRHSFGYAIDINPMINPSVSISQKNKVIPESGAKFVDRTISHIGMIKEDDSTFRAFMDHGWEWGGFFHAGVDYMHFQKSMNEYYWIERLQYIPPDQRIKNLPN